MVSVPGQTALKGSYHPCSYKSTLHDRHGVISSSTHQLASLNMAGSAESISDIQQALGRMQNEYDALQTLKGAVYQQLVNMNNLFDSSHLEGWPPQMQGNARDWVEVFTKEVQYMAVLLAAHTERLHTHNRNRLHQAGRCQECAREVAQSSERRIARERVAMGGPIGGRPSAGA